MAYLKSFYYEDFFNASIYLSSRCILEGFALKELCKRGEIDTLKEELLQKQVFLIEYKYYIPKDFLPLYPTFYCNEKRDKIKYFVG